MPELPEVESCRVVAERHLLGDRITRVATVSDDIVFAGVTPRRFAAALKGRTVTAARRKGKQLWLELDARPWPTFHFGMGGRFYVYHRVQERPRFWKMEIQTESGLRFAMTNARRLGRIRLLEDPANEPPISRLGADPLLEMPSPAVFVAILANRNTPIKALLLNQAVFAGVGNWIADEVLYQARLDPRRQASTLSPTEARRLRQKLAAVLGKAVAVDADADQFPRTWLFHRRWGRNPNAETHRGEPLRFDTVGGRTTAWVPSVQK